MNVYNVIKNVLDKLLKKRNKKLAEIRQLKKDINNITLPKYKRNQALTKYYELKKIYEPTVFWDSKILGTYIKKEKRSN